MATPAEVETERLILRRLTLEDAPFLIELLNQPSFLAHIGDRGVRTLEDARRYLREGPWASYERHGFGLWCVAGREDDLPMGICGLMRRATLPDVDLGYAFLPPYWGQGFALEAARGALRQAANRYGLRRVIAVVSRENAASIRVLEKLGMRFEGSVRLGAEEAEVSVFGRQLPLES